MKTMRAYFRSHPKIVAWIPKNIKRMKGWYRCPDSRQTRQMMNQAVVVVRQQTIIAHVNEKLKRHIETITLKKIENKKK